MSDLILVTGGAGFIGSTLVRALVSRGDRVLVLDDLSRVGSDERLEGLKELDVQFVRGDVSVATDVEAAFEHGPFRAVYHLAAQVAVTWSMQDPRRDFEVNALGSFNVIDAVRRRSPGARCVYMSSNKVYGELAGLESEDVGDRKAIVGRPAGVGVDQPLDPETPYGVSKATGENYFRDAAMTYGIDTVVLRASCIYGPRQSQQEDQGWVAWFGKAVADRLPIRIFGDGRTTRDMLFVDDLVDLYLRILDGDPPPRGLILNVGGGASTARSLLEVVRQLEALTGNTADMTHEDERPGDQPVFITDTSAAMAAYGWQPTTQPPEGMKALLGL
jgi:CDP-paratose 2-epimerase